MTMKMLGATLACCVVLGACATITRGTTSQLQIMSEPSGASVRTSLNQSCTTPCTLNLGRRDELSVVISMPGFADQTVDVKTRVAGAGAAGLVGNVIVGGVIGLGADVVTGAALEHFPNPVSVTLVRTPQASAPAQRLRR
jgi:hypothetical protein